MAVTVRRVGVGLAPAYAPHNEHQDGPANSNDGHPDVDAERANGARGINSQRFNPETPSEVQAHIERKDVARPHNALFVHIDEQSAQSQVPQHLVEKRGLENRIRDLVEWAMLHIDLHTPRKARGPAEQFLIPPVTQTTNGLGQRNAGHQRVDTR